MDFQMVLFCELLSPEHQFFACGIYGVDAHQEKAVVMTSEIRFEEFYALVFLSLGFFLVVVIQCYIRDCCSDTHFGSRLFRGVTMPILIVESGGSGADHFHACRLSAPIYEFLVDFRLHLPDPVDPIAERNIFTDAPHKCHPGMSMHVHESRKSCFSSTIHDFHARCYRMFFANAAGRNYLSNVLSIYVYIGFYSVADDVLK